jgi:hypothetical protein
MLDAPRQEKLGIVWIYSFFEPAMVTGFKILIKDLR